MSHSKFNRILDCSLWCWVLTLGLSSLLHVAGVPGPFDMLPLTFSTACFTTCLMTWHHVRPQSAAPSLTPHSDTNG